MQYSITLKAGVPKPQILSGITLVLMDTGAATQIDLSIQQAGGYTSEEFRGVKRGLKFQSAGISGATLTSAVDCTVQLIVSAANISVNYQDDSTVNANIINLPLSVVPDRGAPNNPVYVSGLTYSDAPATALSNAGPVATSAIEVVVLPASLNRKSAKFANLGPDAVAIGGPGITWAQRCVVLNAGDVYMEDRGANLAWSAITDAGKTASVTVQAVLA